MIKVLKPGLFSTIQDLGRFGVQEWGVPYSGIMDRQAGKIANALLNNSEESAVLEMTITGATLQFKCQTLICLAGANMSPKLNDVLITNYKVIKVQPEDILSFGKLKNGFRTYLAVLGGFRSEICLRSRSMYNGITKQFQVKKGDGLEISLFDNLSFHKNASLKGSNDYLNAIEIKVFSGPEFNLLSNEQQNTLLSTPFTISNHNNRMAYQLNEIIENSLQAIITSPVMPGTVQLTPSGKLIVLMRDCQTTGGYPRVLQLSTSAINSLAQKYTSQTIIFKMIKT